MRRRTGSAPWSGSSRTSRTRAPSLSCAAFEVRTITTTAPLDDEARARIIALHTARVAKAYGVEVEAVSAAFVTEALRRWSTLAGYGTREIIRWIEEAVADEMIAAKSRGTSKVKLAWADGRARVEAA